MAVSALITQAQERFVEIPDFDLGARPSGYQRWLMTLPAIQLGVLALQSKSSKLAMLKLLSVESRK